MVCGLTAIVIHLPGKRPARTSLGRGRADPPTFGEGILVAVYDVELWSRRTGEKKIIYLLRVFKHKSVHLLGPVSCVRGGFLYV